MNIIKMNPIMKEMVWGGRWLADRFGKIIPSDKTGESWEIAAHDNGQSTVADGADQGRTLGEMVKEYKEALVGTAVYEKFGDFFPLLVKFIDANQNLSVQVHPNDEQAVRLEGAGISGKTEMWYILDAQPGAKLVYGFNQDLTREKMAEAIRDGKIEEYLNWVPVQAGDTFYIPAGTLHAIGSGILIAEIQQNSDITYRVYDYGRLGLDGKPRALHVDKAVEVTDTKAAVGQERTDIDAGVRCDFFETYRLVLKDQKITIEVSTERFELLICVDGEGTINGMPCKAGDSYLVPATAGNVELNGAMTMLQSHVA